MLIFILKYEKFLILVILFSYELYEYTSIFNRTD